MPTTTTTPPPSPQPFHPLGPLAYLSVLPVGGTTRCQLRSPPSSSPSSPDNDGVDDGTGRGRVITQLSHCLDVFLIRDMLSSANALMLMDSVAQKGMKVAGMRGTSGNDGGRIRTGWYLTWIDRPRQQQ